MRHSRKQPQEAPQAPPEPEKDEQACLVVIGGSVQSIFPPEYHAVILWFTTSLQLDQVLKCQPTQVTLEEVVQSYDEFEAALPALIPLLHRLLSRRWIDKIPRMAFL